MTNDPANYRVYNQYFIWMRRGNWPVSTESDSSFNGGREHFYTKATITAY